MILERRAVLNALYHQGVSALRQGDQVGAINALLPVAEEAPDAYPDARAWLELASRGGSRRMIGGGVASWLGPARARARPLWGRARRAPLRSWLRATRARVESLWSAALNLAPPGAASALHPLSARLGAAVRREAFPVWGLVTLVVGLLIGGLVVHRGGSVDQPTAASQGPSQVPTVVPDADLFARCDAAIEAENWADAVRACRTLYARDPDYTGLTDRLATAYIGRGEQRLAASDDLGAAAADFEQALRYQPESAEAQRAWQQLHLYRQGDEALKAADWENAVAQLSAASADAPDYLENLKDRSLGAKLFTAWLRWGQSARNAGDLPSAALRCGQALALVPADQEAQECVAAASAQDAALAPGGN